ncbi:MAG: histidine kinase [Candidatus Marinimicrobia bacterium]|nr:histidine kinase [Candidatus Neomarinimicrobiota bacterium]|tara:strand:+ start:3150 stop:3566 length:417 start_codon:yes stop_codon:yes gene_type:complete
MSKQFSVLISNKNSEISIIREKFESFALKNEVEKNIRRNIQIALDEILSNTIQYGYENNSVDKIKVKFLIDHTNLVIEIIDNAKTYNILEKDDPDISKSIEEKPLGGLGIYLVKNLMSKVKYESVNGTNHLTLIKKLN